MKEAQTWNRSESLAGGLLRLPLCAGKGGIFAFDPSKEGCVAPPSPNTSNTSNKIRRRSHWSEQGDCHSFIPMAPFLSCKTHLGRWLVHAAPFVVLSELVIEPSFATLFCSPSLPHSLLPCFTRLLAPSLLHSLTTRCFSLSLLFAVRHQAQREQKEAKKDWLGFCLLLLLFACLLSSFGRFFGCQVFPTLKSGPKNPRQAKRKKREEREEVERSKSINQKQKATNKATKVSVCCAIEKAWR